MTVISNEGANTKKQSLCFHLEKINFLSDVLHTAIVKQFTVNDSQELLS